MKQQQVLGRQLNDRIMQLENQFTNTCLLLEEMKHMIINLSEYKGVNCFNLWSYLNKSYFHKFSYI